MLTREASEQNGWNIDYGATALLWREGCIIRSRFLGDIRDAYAQNPGLAFLGNAPLLPATTANRAAALAQNRRQSDRSGHPGAVHGIRSDLP